MNKIIQYHRFDLIEGTFPLKAELQNLMQLEQFC